MFNYFFSEPGYHPYLLPYLHPSHPCESVSFVDDEVDRHRHHLMINKINNFEKCAHFFIE